MDVQQNAKSLPIPVPKASVVNFSDPFSLASSPDTYISSQFSTGTSSRRLSTAASSVDEDYISLSKGTSHGLPSAGDSTTNLHKLDLALERELQNETSTPNPYEYWECGFGYTGKLDTPAAVPSTKNNFLDAINGEIATIGFVQNGLNSYIKAINSGEYHSFSEDFLRHQNDATHKTIGQLFQIAHNLKDVVREVETLEHDLSEVKPHLREAFRYAQPWVLRTRAVLVSAHVFYKINYVLGSDKKKHIA